MTRKHFERIAHVFRINRKQAYNRQWRELLDDMCIACHAMNDNFDEAKFRAACHA